MRKSLSTSLGIGFAAGVFAIASSVAADQLLYKVVPSESNASLTVAGDAAVDISFDPLNQFPVAATLSGTSNTGPSGTSKVVADTGLPGAFNNGANGITINEFALNYANLPGTLTGFGSLPVPLDLTGSSFQLIGFTAQVSSLNIVLDAPVFSALTPSGNPNEWLYQALASVTISGTLKPTVNVPITDPVTLGEFPFSQAGVPLLLAGTFAGIPTGSQVTVGIPTNAFTNQDLSLPPIAVTGLPLDGLGLINGSFSISNLTLADFSTAAVFRNTTPIRSRGRPRSSALVSSGSRCAAARASHRSRLGERLARDPFGDDAPDRRADHALGRAQPGVVVARHERARDALAFGAAGAADPVRVGLRRGGHVEVDHV
jgi:hypothetical protein